MLGRTVIERGPKGKRSVAFGIDWPGWTSSASSSPGSRYLARYSAATGRAIRRPFPLSVRHPTARRGRR